MRERLLPILLVIIAGLALINLAAFDIVWLKNRGQEGILTPKELTPALTTSEADICGPVCQETIAQEISGAMATISGEKAATTVVREAAPSASQPQAIYIPLGGGGSTTNRNWASVTSAEVYFDVDNYPNFDKIYFEGFIRVKHGNGKVYARLYDVTHEIGVQGSEIEASSENYTRVESGSLNFWKGRNLYRVQIKSLNGYEAFFDSGRIRVVMK